MAESSGRINVQQKTTATRILFNDSSILGEANIKELEVQVLRAVSEAGARDVHLDFTRIRFMASSFIRLLVRVRKEVQAQKGTLTICNVDPKIFEVFKITQLHKVFQFA
ncbi:STAS domain-containing protein [Planctomycetota bacterium]